MKNYFCLIALGCCFLLACEDSSDRPQDLKENFSVAWTLTDSLTLKSSLTDTIVDGWPYYHNDQFYLLSFFYGKAYRFDLEGRMTHIIGKGYGKGPGEFLDVSAMVGMDSMMGIYQMLGGRLALFDSEGGMAKDITLGTEIDGGLYYTNVLNRKFNYYQGRFFNETDPGSINHNFPAYYDLPILSVHDQQGALLNVSGARAPIYRDRLLPYARTVYVDVDSFDNQIFVSQMAAHTWETFNLDGVPTGQFGFPGQYIEDQDWPSIGFVGNPENMEQRQRIIELIFTSPEYGFMLRMPSGHAIRSYRRGVEDLEGLVNFLDKPHFLQIYDREGNLIADQVAPDFHFMPVAVKDGELWVHRRKSYNPSDYSFKLYRYRLDIQEKV